MKLWKRAIEVTASTYKVTGLRMSFAVQRDLSAKANSAEVQFYNLAADTRGKLTVPGVPVLIMAGYEEGMQQLFLGEMRTCTHRREGPDVITKLTTGDGDKIIRGYQLNMSLGKGTKKEDVFKALADAVGIKDSAITDKLKGASLRAGKTEWGKGLALIGNAWSFLVGLASDAGLELSVQDGTVQVLDKGKPTNDKDILLDVASGLIGSPEIGDDGKVKGKSLLQGGIYPGRALKITSQFIAGSRYRCESVRHVGDTHGQDWYSEFEAVPL